MNWSKIFFSYIEMFFYKCKFISIFHRYFGTEYRNATFKKLQLRNVIKKHRSNCQDFIFLEKKKNPYEKLKYFKLLTKVFQPPQSIPSTPLLIEWKTPTPHCIIWYRLLHCLFFSQENKDAQLHNLKMSSTYMVNTENGIASLPPVNHTRILLLWITWWSIWLLHSSKKLFRGEVASCFPLPWSVLHNVSQFWSLALTALVHNHWHSRSFFSCSVPCGAANATQLKISF